ncbi:unnamed protein product [Closterium sp. NIES-54]
MAGPASEGLGFESQCVHFGHPSAGGCQRSTGDPRLILGKGYRLIVLGGYGRTDPLLNKPFYLNGRRDSVTFLEPPEPPEPPEQPEPPESPKPPEPPSCPTAALPLHLLACPGPTYSAWRATSLLVPAVMATPSLLTFDTEGRAVDFEVWLDDLQLFLQCDRADGLSLFYLTSGVSRAPPATADSTFRSQWATRDAAARLAVRRHLPTTERALFSQYRSAQTLYDAVVARYSSPATAALSRLFLPYLFPDLAAFPTVADLITHLRTSDTRYRAALLADACLTFTLPASPQQNGIAERRIGMVMDVARTSMIHVAAPHFLWPFAVQYAAHQLNL